MMLSFAILALLGTVAAVNYEIITSPHDFTFKGVPAVINVGDSVSTMAQNEFLAHLFYLTVLFFEP